MRGNSYHHYLYFWKGVAWYLYCSFGHHMKKLVSQPIIQTLWALPYSRVTLQMFDSEIVSQGLSIVIFTYCIEGEKEGCCLVTLLFLGASYRKKLERRPIVQMMMHTPCLETLLMIGFPSNNLNHKTFHLVVLL